MSKVPMCRGCFQTSLSIICNLLSWYLAPCSGSLTPPKNVLWMMIGDMEEHFGAAFFFRMGRTQTSRITQWKLLWLSLFYKYVVNSTRDRKSPSFILRGSALGTLRNKRVLLKRTYTLFTKRQFIHPPEAEPGSYLYNISNTENWLHRKGNVLNYAEILP